MESKLKILAADIEEEFKVQVRIIVADFSKGLETFKNIEQVLDTIPIGLFVNAFGVAVYDVGNMCSLTREELTVILNTNIEAVTELSRYFLQRMYYNNTKAAIVNISSCLEIYSTPFSALYDITKIYNRKLTLALQQESRRFKVHVQHVLPCLVPTKTIQICNAVLKDSKLFTPDPEAFVHWAVSTIGRLDESTGQLWYADQFFRWLSQIL
ncbi:very-long-chain 3-oxoacyl-CoA reductase-like [Teleopsis dalmanni]|uniref:very-long-chain 3-oxoacyl-CoA reductase-like n=1 Tax=Teleopsis dalmanni TaxID=139649 RepID=UPI0018CDA0FB|nr:very-long-chain 3-oxoacyl-CoA reductase-like [Teleopsis dalmanni]